jgi:antitoxin (DNA-binding transcriptional repressor) of toxin-antitoxin stability system
MNAMTVGDFKANFSEVLKKVLNGEEVAISYGKRKEIVARLVPGSGEKKQKRKIGLFENKGKVVFKKNFSITEEEFLGV